MTALTGQVTNSAKPAANADVVVVAWPRQDLLEAVPDEGKVETQIVATARTDLLLPSLFAPTRRIAETLVRSRA